MELPQRDEYHKDAIKLNTGRNCLEYILRVHSYSKVYIPYYTCDVLLEPFKKLDIPYEFYHINIHLEIRDEIVLNAGEALLYTNYFGLKQRYVEQLAEKVGSRLIVDNTQAFYAKPIQGIDTFYTCRKYFGVPDGAYLYCDKELDEEIEQDYSYDRVAHLVKRIDLSAEEGFKHFRRVDDGLDNQPIRKMSKLTQRMMQSIGYNYVANQRRKNYLQLHSHLEKSNLLAIQLDDQAVPMVYPYLTDKENLRQHLIQNKVFVAKYWPNVVDWVCKSTVEYRMVNTMIPLPIDQRYEKATMEYIISFIS